MAGLTQVQLPSRIQYARNYSKIDNVIFDINKINGGKNMSHLQNFKRALSE